MFYLHLCASCAFLVPKESRGRHQIPGTGVIEFWVVMWMLGIEPFGRTDIGFNCWIHSPVHDKDIWMWGFLSQFSKFLSCFSFFYLLGDFIRCLWSCSVFPPFLSVSPSLLYVMHRFKPRALCMLAKYSISEQHLLISTIFSNNFSAFIFLNS